MILNRSLIILFLNFIFLINIKPIFPKVITVKDLLREHDPIIIKGDRLKLFLNKEIEKIRLYAYINNEFIPIPFQIDKKNEKDEFVISNQEDIDAKLFNKNDEIVFMAKDTGSQVNKDEFPLGYELVSEVEIRDTVDYTRGWVYIFYFDNPPPKSRINYVDYIPAEDKVIARNYIIKFSKDAPIVFDELILTEEGGGNGENIADRLKIRLWIELHIGIKARIDEEDFESYIIGYIDGPVRVIRKRSSKAIFWGIFSSPKAVSEEIFYYSFFEFPFVVSFPFDIKEFFRKAVLRLTTEMSAPFGYKFYNSNNLKGVDIDGVTSDEEKNLDLSPFNWITIAGTKPDNYGSWLTRLGITSQIPIMPQLYYVDDINKPDPPENSKGQVGNIGYYMDRFEWVKKGLHKFICYMYNLPKKYYEIGDEVKILNILDNPLKIWVGKVMD